MAKSRARIERNLRQDPVDQTSDSLFLLNIRHFLDERALQILLTLGGKQGLKSERDGPYLVLRGLQKFLICLNALAVLGRYGQLDVLLHFLDAL